MRYVLVPTLALGPVLCAAQLLMDNGLPITVQAGAQITVKGDVLVTSGATFTNAGTIDLSGDLTNNSNGPLFTPVPGQVIMNGTAQSIGGAAQTRFDGLDLQCTTLTLLQDVSVGGDYVSPAGVLQLKNADVLLNGQLLSTTNASPAAITRINGMLVSETAPPADPGRFGWAIGTHAPASYTIPFGNDVSNDYLPVTMDIIAASADPLFFISFATYPTDPFAAPNNRPLPAGLSALTTLGGLENAQNVVDRFWLVSTGETDLLPTATLKFTYRDSEWNTGTNTIMEPALQAQRFNGSVWSSPPSGTANTLANSVTTSVTNAFDQVWALVQSSTPLPVELLYFNAAPDGREVLCSWATATEQDNDFFTVERSSDGELFEDIGEVDGAGTSYSTLHYGFTDHAPLPGLSYYRLRQTDLDGSEVLSAIVPVWMDEGGGSTPLVLWPNPAHDVLNIVGTTAGERLTLWDGSGRRVLDAGLSKEGTTVLDISHLPEGVYLLRGSAPGHEEVVRFVRADR